MDVSLIDPSLLAEQSSKQPDQQPEEHDSDLDAEGEDEEDLDAEGEEWDEPEIDQYLYVPQEETQVSQGLSVIDVDHYNAPGPSSLAPLASHAPEYHFELPPEDPPAPGLKRRGRPPKSDSRSRNGSAAPPTPSSSYLIDNATPGPSRLNGPTRPARTLSTPLPKSKSAPGLSSTAKGKGRAHTSTSVVPSSKSKPAPPTPVKDPLCSFCMKDESCNKSGVPEKMVGCHKCGQSGHPTCLGMNGRLARAVMLYKWSCLDCKLCEACNSKGDDSKLLFCDGCDKGYHFYCLDPPLDRPPKASFFCEPCKAERAQQRKLKAVSSTPHAASNGASSGLGTNGKGKGRADPLSSLAHHDMDLSQHPVIKISSQPRRGRPPKHPRYEDSSVFDDWDDRRSASATPQPTQSGVKKRKGRRDEMEDEDDEGDDASYSASPAPRLTVRLTVGGRGRGRGRGRGSGRGRGRGRGRGGMMGEGAASSAYLDVPVEDEEEELGMMEVEEEEEEQIPYGGIITGADADTSKTNILESDKAAFAKSAQAAEKRLGGPRVDTWDPIGLTPGGDKDKEKSRKRKFEDEEYGGSPGPGAGAGPGTLGTPAPKIARGRSLRDRLLDRSLGVSASSPDIGGPSGTFDTTSPGPLATPTRSSAANGSYFPLALDAHGAASPAPAASAPNTPGPMESTQGAETGKSMKINQIRFGNMDIDTWYSAPYPEEYQYVPDGRLWLCEFCLRYMHSGFQAGRHRLKCKARHPPGDEIYREGEVSVFEVDGRKNKIYCQQLCLLAKMFLESKTLYYDVEPFLFYVMTQVDDLGARFVGYFSKEKRSPLNNVSCIMTLPVRQRKGWGQLLIDFSYALSKKEERVGSPEKPLSGLGEVTYKTYWKLTVFRYLRDAVGEVSMDDISKATSMTLFDIYNTLKDQDMIRLYTPSPPPVLLPIAYRNRLSGRGRGRGRGRGGAAAAARRAAAAAAESQSDASDENKVPEKGTYRITFDREYVLAVIKQDDAKGKLQLRSERLKYHPFLVTRAVKEAKEKEAAQAARKEQEQEDEDEGAVEAQEAHGGGDEVAHGVRQDESSDKTQVMVGDEAGGVKALNGTLDVIAGQRDALILERVEELAGPEHEHDQRRSHTHPVTAVSASIVNGNATPRKSATNGTAQAHSSVSEGKEGHSDYNDTDPTSLGKDKETLQLVAALNGENGSPKRSLRKKSGSVSVAGTPRRDRTGRSVRLEEASPMKGR